MKAFLHASEFCGEGSESHSVPTYLWDQGDYKYYRYFGFYDFISIELISFVILSVFYNILRRIPWFSPDINIKHPSSGAMVV